MKKIFIVVIILAVLILFFFLIWIGINIRPGSYAYAEKYELPYEERDIIRAVEIFKNRQPQYKVPEIMGLTEGRRDSMDYWYHLYFYYEKEQQIVHAWLRPMGNESTTLGFVAINYGLQLGNWKDINNDLSWKKNRAEKEKFEQTILAQIEKILSENR